ncbi:copper transporter [Nocardiopsis sp. NPDC058631]|uniref:copper transporter n=1 Tax=Nocardiopsis sp. NPDC058631 TaxID=3346566 RepID=UPI00364AC79D
MIDFRYHLVSIVAVFLALTVGLVLGTTMLQDPLLNTLQSETSDLRGQSEDLRSERDVADKVNAGADEMAEAVSSDMLAGRLTDLGVVVVTSPGANHEVADGLAERVEEAGGEVVGRIALADALVDAGNATFVDELSIQVSPDPDDLTGGPYEKAGTELGRALATADAETETDAETDAAGEAGTGGGTAEETKDGEDAAARDRDGDHDAEAVLDAFSEGGLIQVEGEPAVSADALVVLAPAAGTADGADREAANAVLTTITTALHREVGAVVLAGDGPSSRGDGMLAQARAAEPEFATADVTGRPMGDIIAVLALAENLAGGAGAYGIGEGVRGFLPDPLPSARDVEDQASGSAEDAVSDEGGRVDESRRTVRGGE